jgi:hypothetical protein
MRGAVKRSKVLSAMCIARRTGPWFPLTHSMDGPAALNLVHSTSNFTVGETGVLHAGYVV